MDLKQDDVVLCTVKDVQGTTVFITIDDYANYDGSIVFSEIAAGRIRNLREYVHPGRKIVCKVLRISGNHVELSLRRVTGKEKEIVLEKSKREYTIKKILNTIVDNSEEVLNKIKKEYDFVDFFEDARTNPSILKKFFNEKAIEKLKQILSEKEEKKKFVKEVFVLRTNSESGVSDIKNILDLKDCDVRYLGSSKFSIEFSGTDFKEINHKMQEILKEIEKKAKEKKAVFEIKWK